MDPNKQPDVAERSKPRFRLGQEAVESFEASSKTKPQASEQKSSEKPPLRVDAMHQTLNKRLMECYPEIADDDSERLLADVRRHWLGRLGIIITGAILIILLIGFMIAAPSLIRGIGVNVDAPVKAAIAFLSLFVGILIVVGLFIMIWIYNQNHLLITDENIIEVRQINLFSRKVSHLNMINVEDVTVYKKGILQTAFNYGTLSIETAGEKDNFSFAYTPDPDIYRRMVINAHEDAIDRIGKLGSATRVEITNNGL